VDCFGNKTGEVAVTAVGGTGLYTYAWSPNASGQVSDTIRNVSAGLYVVTVTDANGCSLTATAEVSQPSLLTASATQVNLLCNGDNSGQAAVAAAGGTPDYTYLWNDPANTPTANATGLSADSYTVTVTDGNGCSAVTSVTLTEPTAVGIIATTEDTNCYGSKDGQISLVGSGGASPYQYSYNGGLTYVGNSIGLGLAGGVYPVAIRDNNGCVVRDTVFIQEPLQIQVDAGADLSIEYGDAVQLTALTTNIGTPVLSWTANPVDSGMSCTTCATPMVAPIIDTYYTVTATNENGCSVTDDVWVRVTVKRRVFIANAITPNGDNTNDALFVQGGRGTERVNMFRVYDRWGELVFEATDTELNNPALGWDGTFKGQPMNPGVFVYVAEVRFEDGQTMLLKGDVTLLR
jgi:gliding motility-associated-like protein